jgi:transketolase
MTVQHLSKNMLKAAPSHLVMADAVRFLAADAVERAKSGHPGMPMGMADVATVLFSRFLKFDAADPHWPDRDRFVLSAGHGSMLLYALLYLTGYEAVTLDELKRFRQWGSKTPGHPEYGHTPGVETTTGPLGQGLATAVGMALAERILNARYGDGLVDHFTYVIAGDGCLMEGISHEAISLAGHLKLSRLIVLFDDNQITIDGATSLSCSDDQLIRFLASGWSVRRVDGHDHDAIAHAIAEERETNRPSLIACRTVIGYGAPTRQGTEKVHGSARRARRCAGPTRRSRFRTSCSPAGERPAREAASPGMAGWSGSKSSMSSSAKVLTMRCRVSCRATAALRCASSKRAWPANGQRSRPARPRSWCSRRSRGSRRTCSAARPISRTPTSP